jgi:hypothetical protein
MKRSLLILSVSAFFSLTSFAQITITNATFPAPWDTLFTAVDNLPSGIAITPPGGGQSWNFTSLQSPFTRQTIARPASQGNNFADFPDAELVSNLSDNAESYFNVTSTRMELIGYAGEDPLGLGLELSARLNPPLVERRAPMNFFDVNQMDAALLVPFSADDIPAAILNQLPFTPDSLRVRIAINRLDVVDAWGTLTIPGGIYDVLREKRTEYRDARLDVKIGVFPWQDITDIALQFLDFDELGRDTTIRYIFFSDEAKEPIAIVTMDGLSNNPRFVEYKANNIVSNVQNAAALKPGVYAFPNPAIVNVRFEFSGLPAGDYKLRIFNILGMEVWNRKYYVNGSRTEKVDISSLRKGAYLYSLENSRGKTISTKRLIVVRP